MEWLIKAHLVEIAEPKPGCLALYQGDERRQLVSGACRDLATPDSRNRRLWVVTEF